ncbi:hypothetical protein CEXT_193811 [Caerostris extrusa]|uniref:Uncharacterized protein n=1 Tax=Caerostris extrusa TaxID=172846 RepID=A0AAV4VY48_CAEEX|nr:hypothetical protein CEXT_193811 [Caerostris extrusa]
MIGPYQKRGISHSKMAWKFLVLNSLKIEPKIGTAKLRLFAPLSKWRTEERPERSYMQMCPNCVVSFSKAVTEAFLILLDYNLVAALSFKASDVCGFTGEFPHVYY